MKQVIIGLILLSITYFLSPAAAQTLYNNGPTNGNTDAWTINFGYIVSDTFPVGSGGATIGGFSFAMWLFPGDVLTSAELSITSSEFGGTSYFDQTVTFTQSGCVVNNYGYDVCTESTTFAGPTLNSGTYWLNLQNASVPSGDPVYWDENSGPSSASESAVGTIPSESFTLLCCGTTGPSTPEPSSMLLLGSGCMTLFGLLSVRRKLF